MLEPPHKGGKADALTSGHCGPASYNATHLPFVCPSQGLTLYISHTLISPLHTVKVY